MLVLIQTVMAIRLVTARRSILSPPASRDRMSSPFANFLELLLAWPMEGPGVGILNFSVGKKFHFSESKYLLAKADVFNILNHPNYALSNGNVFSTVGVTTATTTPGYAVPTDPNFLNARGLFSGGFRSM